MDEIERDDDVLNTQNLAMIGSTLDLPLIVIAPIVECDCEGNIFVTIIEQGDGVHSPTDDDN